MIFFFYFPFPESRVRVSFLHRKKKRSLSFLSLSFFPSFLPLAAAVFDDPLACLAKYKRRSINTVREGGGEGGRVAKSSKLVKQHKP